jgi:hypothetical protein
MGNGYCFFSIVMAIILLGCFSQNPGTRPVFDPQQLHQSSPAQQEYPLDEQSIRLARSVRPEFARYQSNLTWLRNNFFGIEPDRGPETVALNNEEKYPSCGALSVIASTILTL